MMKNHLLSITLIILTGLFIYGATLQSPYHWDDYRTIVDNPALADPFRLHTIFTFWPTRVFLFWTFSLNYAAGSHTLFAYHLTNIAIHLTAAIFLYLLIYRTLSVAGPTPVAGFFVEQVVDPAVLTDRMADNPDLGELWERFLTSISEGRQSGVACPVLDGKTPPTEVSLRCNRS